jgi:hypothetical protein
MCTYISSRSIMFGAVPLVAWLLSNMYGLIFVFCVSFVHFFAHAYNWLLVVEQAHKKINN